MALRVLLADRSEEIRHVFSYSLQDYAVDVQTVDVGTDVIEVAKKFLPDIIFLDVLLQKKNGYEVSSLIKTDPQLRSVPVVLLWSGFMAFDEGKARACMADARLEKPFDVEALRQIVQALVPKTKSSGFHDHLIMPQFLEKPSMGAGSDTVSATVAATVASPPAPPAVTSPVTTSMAQTVLHQPPPTAPSQKSADQSSWNMDQFEPLPDLELQMKHLETPSDHLDGPSDHRTTVEQLEDIDNQAMTLSGREAPENIDQWQRKDLTEFQIPLPPGSEKGEVVLDADLMRTLKDDFQTPTKTSSPSPTVPQAASKNTPPQQPTRQNTVLQSTAPKPSAETLIKRTKDTPIEVEVPDQVLGDLQMEKALKDFLESRAEELIATYIENYFSKKIPEMASQVIRQEIMRLLGEGPETHP